MKVGFHDGDDFIVDEDVFDTAYKASENRKFDIIAFLHFNSGSYYSKVGDIESAYSSIPHNKTVFQPELSVYTQFGKDGFNFFDYRIWEKFYKVDKARTREYGGSGIGLSIVKAIMDAHNNSYGVENVDGGVCFYFEADTK